MVNADYIYQSIDWWHSEIPGSQENFNHEGLLNSKLINLGLNVGINDYWNLSFSQLIGERCMEWQSVDVDGNIESSEHHRTECSSSDYTNAHGGYLGDTRISFKYLIYNQGKGPGQRFFTGGGLIIPSKNILTESPFIDEDIDNNGSPGFHHRHFSLSDGTYKIFSEIQYFKKRIKMPVFWGGTIYAEFPLGDSDYGFTPSQVYEISLMALSGPIKIKTNFIKISSIGLNFIVRHTTESKWHDIETPNSKSTSFIPGLSILFMSKLGTFGVNIQKPHIDNLATNDLGVNQKSEVWQFSISYRRVLDKIIDRLYW